MRHLLGFRWADPRRSFAFRLTLVIVALVTVTVAGVTYMAVQIVQDNLRGQIGERFEAQATDVNDLVHVFLEGRVSQVQVMATSDAIVGSVDRRNASYPGGAEEALSEIQSLDERWIAAADDDPLVVSVIDPEENETAHWLADFLTSFADHSEVFVTDRFGATLASTGRLSDYYQADEGWWQAAWNDGNGAVYISDPEFDESAGVTALLIAVPIVSHHTGEVVGVARTTLDVGGLSALVDSVKFGQTGHAVLLGQSGQVLFNPLDAFGRSHASMLPADVKQQASLNLSGFEIGKAPGQAEFIFGFAPLSESLTAERSGDLERQSEAAIAQLGWSSVVVQEKNEAFAASSAIVRGSVAVGIAMVIAAALVAFLVARAVTRPIGQLAASARDVAEGNLKATAVVTGKDEIGVLAHAINRMTESLLSASKRRELEESITKFAALVESSSDFIAITSLDGKVQFVNRGGRALVGLEPDEDVTSLTMNDFLAEEDLRAADEIGISAVKATGQWTGESTLRHFRDGSAIPVLIDSFAIADPETGHPIAQATIQRDNTERKQAEDALRENEARTRKIIDTAYDAFISIGTDDVITAWNSQAEQIFGWTREEAIGLRFAKTIIPLRYRTAHENGIERFLATGEGPLLNERIEISALHRDGHEFPVELAIWKVGSGDELAFNAFIHDITERKQAEEELRKLSRAVEQSPSLVMITDPNGNIEYVNPKFTEVTGYLPEDVLGKNPRILQSGETSPEVYSRLWQTITSGGQWRGDLHNKRKSGELYWASAVIAPVLDEEGAVVHYVGLQEDVTKRKEAEDAIGHLAFHDPLTGLPNRRLFTDRLALALTQARRTRDAVAVLFLDLDHFKTVNDTAGHGKGDELLQSVGQRLTKVVRDGDTVSRLGGDEFTVLLPGISQVEDAAEVAERILEEFRGPWVLDGYTFHLTISIGIGLYPDDGEDAKTLLTNADTALYRAKAQGRDNFQFYYSEMNASILERTDLEADLRGALEREEFVIHYQPQVNITTGRVVGMEALVRWQHPDRGLIPPVEFIPLAEETGLIFPLGECVLRTACEQHKAWREAGLPSIRMAVNISARQFKSRKLTATVSRILEETGLDPGFLQLEITEGVAMQDMEATTAILRALREVGVEVALDDFGTGYSSLGYLANFPIDVLKIDRSFVSDLPMDESAVAITTAIITLAHSLNLSVIAEGIETDEQLAWLKTHGCDEFQGYLFSKPLPAGEIETLLGRSQSLETSKR